jgi:hypothetical protein
MRTTTLTSSRLTEYLIGQRAWRRAGLGSRTQGAKVFGQKMIKRGRRAARLRGLDCEASTMLIVAEWSATMRLPAPYGWAATHARVSDSSLSSRARSYTLPRLTTRCSLRVAVMSCKGSASSTIRSASLFFSTLP